MTDSTFSRGSSTSSASSASSVGSSSVNDTKTNNNTPERLEPIAQQLEIYRAIAATGTKLSRQEIFAACGSWPINLMWEALFIFHPLEGPAGPFEHKRDSETGQTTDYSRWYFMHAKMKWRKPLVISVELEEVNWGGSEKEDGEGRKRDNTSWEKVGPIGEMRE